MFCQVFPGIVITKFWSNRLVDLKTYPWSITINSKTCSHLKASPKPLKNIWLLLHFLIYTRGLLINNLSKNEPNSRRKFLSAIPGIELVTFFMRGGSGSDLYDKMYRYRVLSILWYRKHFKPNSMLCLLELTAKLSLRQSI